MLHPCDADNHSTKLTMKSKTLQVRQAVWESTDVAVATVRRNISKGILSTLAGTTCAYLVLHVCAKP